MKILFAEMKVSQKNNTVGRKPFLFIIYKEGASI